MRSLILTFECVILSLMSIAQVKPVSKYFEGIVEYEITAKSYMQGVTDNEIRERNGARLRFYFKNGDYVREYLDGGGYTLRKFYYLESKKMAYDHSIMHSPDTIYTIDPTETLYESYTIKPGKKEKVLNYECASSVISVKYVSSFLPDTGTVTMTYFFASELPVNPEWHKDTYIWKDVIQEHKSIAVKFIEDDPFFFSQTFTAAKVLWQPVPEETFKIDPKLIQVKAPKL